MKARVTKKRRKTSDPIHRSGKLTIREVCEKSDGYTWSTFMVQGWQEGGIWKRKKFKNLEQAKGFVALKSVQMLNAETALNTVVTSLTQSEVKEAEAAFRRLRGKYTLDTVIDYFIRHHFDPENPKDFSVAIEEFLDAKEKAGLTTRSLRALRETLNRFLVYTLSSRGVDAVPVHELTSLDVAGFLGGLRGKDGGIARRKSYNNNRLEISSFFSWACDGLQRHLPENPVGGVPHYEKRQVEDQRTPIEILSPDQTRKLFAFLEGFKEGAYCRYYALACFGGLRPESEIMRLNTHPRQHELIDLKHREIELPSSITPKSASGRTVTIQPNLAEWLKRYPGAILPVKNVPRDLEHIRKTIGLSQDVCRHSWFTYTIGRDDSVATAALEGGNSESIVKAHYFKVATKRKKLAQEFWSIIPASH